MGDEIDRSSIKNASVLKELHDSVEQELITSISRWGHRVIVVLPGAASVLLFAYGQDNSFVNPLIVSLTALVAGLFSIHVQWIVSFVVFTIIIVKHSLAQGCSASLLPAIYGFLPCAFGLLFRTRRAVILSTVVVLIGTFIIFAVDLSGYCATQPIVESQKVLIVADRLFPLLVLILGNSAVLAAIVRQSQKSLLLHAKAAQSAARLADVRRDVLHRVTHELRTPLNGLVGSVELLTTSSTIMNNKEDMENALTIKSCLQNIVRICDNVLLAAKSNSATTAHADLAQEGDADCRIQEKNEAAFSLASCVDDVAETFAAAAAAKGIKLKVEFRGNTRALVLGMEVELRQVFLNLVGNALKFTETGSITIRVLQQDPPTASTLPPNRMRFKFQVQDTGIGIATQNRSMLFEAFQQGEQDVVSRQHKGTGLGLTICRDLVALMGGKIMVEGARGQGSCFYFTLDFKREPPVEGDTELVSPTDGTDDGSRRITVVIADSEAESRTCCQSIVASVSPSADSITVGSALELLDTTERVKLQSASDSRIAIVNCDSTSDDLGLSLESTLSKLKASGWLVLAYCQHDRFSFLIDNSSAAYAIFRKPLPLIQLGEMIQNAMNNVPSQLEGRRSTVNSQDRDFAVPHSIEYESTAMDLGGEKRQPKGGAKVGFPSHARIVVVDDTNVNVKVLVKMLARMTSVPIVSCFDGQSAVDLVEATNSEDLLLFLMDWHMPGLCGLSATDSIRRIAKERGGPTVYICMITADIEGLHNEMDRRQIHYEGTVSKGELIKEGESGDVSTTESAEELSTAMRLSRQLERKHSDGFAVIDIVAEKPVTFSSIQAILSWFQKTVEETMGAPRCPVSEDDIT